MTLTLFDDQLELRERVRASMRKHRCILIHATTGFGKTVLAADMIARARRNNRSALFTVPRRQLLWQSAAKFAENGIDFGYITSGKKGRESEVQLATLGSIITRMDAVTPSVVFIDEGHYSLAQCITLARHYLATGAWVIFLTATPKPGMDAVVEDVVAGESVAWMIKNKRLSEYRAFSPGSPDLSMIPRVGGEYHQEKLADKMEHDRILVGNMAKHWKELSPGRCTLAYGTSVAHAEIMAHEFREAGIPSASISAKTPDDKLLEIIRGFARREIKILTNCDMATFGFDLSAAAGMDVTVEAMIDGGPTLSIIKQTQKNGRFLRYEFGKVAILADHAGNIIHRDGTRNHGMPCDDRVWSIASDAKAGVAARATPIKQCPSCLGNHRPAPECTLCGHVYKIDGRIIRQEDGTLIEVHKTEVPKPREEFTDKEKSTIDALKKQAIEAGINPAHAQNWAKKKMREGKVR